MDTDRAFLAFRPIYDVIYRAIPGPFESRCPSWDDVSLQCSFHISEDTDRIQECTRVPVSAGEERRECIGILLCRFWSSHTRSPSCCLTLDIFPAAQRIAERPSKKNPYSKSFAVLGDRSRLLFSETHPQPIKATGNSGIISTRSSSNWQSTRQTRQSIRLQHTKDKVTRKQRSKNANATNIGARTQVRKERVRHKEEKDLTNE